MSGSGFNKNCVTDVISLWKFTLNILKPCNSCCAGAAQPKMPNQILIVSHFKDSNNIQSQDKQKHPENF